MLLNALDLLRTLGWGIVDFIFSLIDTLFEILKSINMFNIIDTIADNSLFESFHTGIITISLSLIALFIIFKFTMKILEPDEGLSVSQIVMEIFKCLLLIILSTFLFAEVSTFSIKLSSFTANIFEENDVTLSDDMLSMYVDYTDSWMASDDFVDKNIELYIANDSFTNMGMYNDKFVTDENWIMADEEDYMYSIDWIMAIIVGGFFLYALFFSGMMLARRQIEFLFLFTISPIIFATSVGNKQRRGAVFEQLASLTLQSAVVMLIISITALVMQSVNETTFFVDSTFKDIVVKSLMFLGAGTFLLTGSQVVNRFIGGNVSANSGREQMMSLMGFSNVMGSGAGAMGLAAAGTGAFGLGLASKGISTVSSGGANITSKTGNAISKFGKTVSGIGSSSGAIAKAGNSISNYGNKMVSNANSKLNKVDSSGVNIPTMSNRLNSFGGQMMKSGKDNLSDAIGSVLPTRNYRGRYRGR